MPYAAAAMPLDMLCLPRAEMANTIETTDLVGECPPNIRQSVGIITLSIHGGDVTGQIQAWSVMNRWYNTGNNVTR